YRCLDGKFLSVGAIEPQFREALFRGLALSPDASREAIATVIASRTREGWAAHFAGTDACVAPVLDMGEAPVHPHNIARRTFIDLEGVFQPAPAPRYSVTSTVRPEPPRREGEDGEAILASLGYGEEEIRQLLKAD
ncbi:MAG TPA: CoA transferase, partial [Sphingomicrobium sp.]|nr:CoA transferase [Sphingomicrobium sp.]